MNKFEKHFAIGMSLLLSTSVISTTISAQDNYQPLNDTGLGENKYSSNQSNYYFFRKDLPTFPGQDPEYGRDAANAADKLNKVGGGSSGFDFSSHNDCVVDNVTGLTWEVKSDASEEGLQSNKWTFSWLGDDVPVKVMEQKAVVIPLTPEAIVAQPQYEDILLNSEVLFDYDQAILTEQASNSISEYIEQFKERYHQIKEITVIGHTDNVASQKYNKKLSEKRAQAVATFLEKMDGMPDPSIEAIGKGKLEPIESNETEQGRAKNRRVVIRLELNDEFVDVPTAIVTDGAQISDLEKEIMASETNDNKKKSVKPDVSEQLNMRAESAVRAICSDNEDEYSCTTTEYISKMNEQELCGYTDWRLPTREELRSIVDYGVSMPSIDKEYFPNMLSSAYWTSTRYANSPFSVWVVDFEHGGDNTHEKHRAIPIRLVRNSSSNTKSVNKKLIKQDESENVQVDQEAENVDKDVDAQADSKGEIEAETDQNILSPIITPVTKFWNELF